jgi:hypothetical protein
MTAELGYCVIARIRGALTRRLPEPEARSEPELSCGGVV